MVIRVPRARRPAEPGDAGDGGDGDEEADERPVRLARDEGNHTMLPSRWDQGDPNRAPGPKGGPATTTGGAMPDYIPNMPNMGCRRVQGPPYGQRPAQGAQWFQPQGGKGAVFVQQGHYARGMIPGYAPMTTGPPGQAGQPYVQRGPPVQRGQQMYGMDYQQRQQAQRDARVLQSQVQQWEAICRLNSAMGMLPPRPVPLQLLRPRTPGVGTLGLTTRSPFVHYLHLHLLWKNTKVVQLVVNTNNTHHVQLW
eukprot:s2965_g8.t1